MLMVWFMNGLEYMQGIKSHHSEDYKELNTMIVKLKDDIAVIKARENMR